MHDFYPFPQPWMLRFDAVPDRKFPQCVAHRGYKARYPENTMEAFRAAIDAGADAIETDLHLTRDHHIVLSHDASLKRCYGVNAAISSLDYGVLESLKTIDSPELPLPRLETLFNYLADPSLAHIWVLLDLKVDDDAETLVILLAKVLSDRAMMTAAWKRRILLGCWAEKYIRLCAHFLPGFPVTYLAYSTTYSSPIFRYPNVACTATRWILSVWPTSPRFVAKMQADDRSLMSWQTDGKGSLEWSIQAGLAGVVTNDPERFIRLRQHGPAGVRVRFDLLTWIKGVAVYMIALVYGFLVFERRHAGDVP